MDTLTPLQRSRLMSGIGSENTKPELVVRKTLFRLGYRFRLHNKNLVGKPDIVLKKYKTVIFVNGCFWHSHTCTKGRTHPKSNKMFWEKKLRANKTRDIKNIRLLKREGWKVIILWECQLRNQSQLLKKLCKISPSKKNTVL